MTIKDDKAVYTLQEILAKLDEMEKEIIEKTTLYHINVKEVVNHLVKELEGKSNIIIP